MLPRHMRRVRFKAWIVRLAICGLIPLLLADWLLEHGGLRDE